jgi:hypothetical protein
MVYTGLIIATGLFSIAECFIINLILGPVMITIMVVHQRSQNLTQIYNLVVIILFNLIDSKLHGSKEIDSFNNIMMVDQKFNQISEFVDRLLPKHV